MTFLGSDEYFLYYLQLRADEPCTNRALKCLHEAFGFLEVVAEVVLKVRLTTRPRYMNMYSELLTKTGPGKAPRQAPRPLLGVLEALGETLLNVTVPPFGQVCAWF